ncbi:DNA-binding response regulator [Bacteroidia bacterium]|nr:DNA-binding response regulator [Bacteroidia bacterium]
MKAVIIEDEVVAAQALQLLLTDVCPEIEIAAVLQSIDESVDWFQTNAMPDLVFVDIHLADGSSFSIFEEVSVTCPIIFTTAYDEYALKAFEVNSIDYLLKPINKKDLERAIHKYEHFLSHQSYDKDFMQNLVQSIKKYTPAYKSYFLVAEKDKLIPVATKDIACIFIDSKIVKAITHTHKAYYLDPNLDELMQQLDPSVFFRANRQYIVSRDAVKDISLWFGSKFSYSRLTY